MKIPDKIAKELKPGQAIVVHSVPNKSGKQHVRFLTAQVNNNDADPLMPTGTEAEAEPDNDNHIVQDKKIHTQAPMFEMGAKVTGEKTLKSHRPGAQDLAPLPPAGIELEENA